MRVSAAGGKPDPVTRLAEGEVTQRWPQLLPGGRALLYTSCTTVGTCGNAAIMLQPLPAGPAKVLVRGGYYARYLRSGHLVYLHDGTLFAAPFDLDHLALTGSLYRSSSTSAPTQPKAKRNSPRRTRAPPSSCRATIRPLRCQ